MCLKEGGYHPAPGGTRECELNAGSPSGFSRELKNLVFHIKLPIYKYGRCIQSKQLFQTLQGPNFELNENYLWAYVGSDIQIQNHCHIHGLPSIGPQWAYRLLKILKDTKEMLFLWYICLSIFEGLEIETANIMYLVIHLNNVKPLYIIINKIFLFEKPIFSKQKKIVRQAALCLAYLDSHSCFFIQSVVMK